MSERIHVLASFDDRKSMLNAVDGTSWCIISEKEALRVLNRGDLIGTILRDLTGEPAWPNCGYPDRYVELPATDLAEELRKHLMPDLSEEQLQSALWNATRAGAQNDVLKPVPLRPAAVDHDMQVPTGTVRGFGVVGLKGDGMPLFSAAHPHRPMSLVERWNHFWALRRLKAKERNR